MVTNATDAAILNIGVERRATVAGPSATVVGPIGFDVARIVGDAATPVIVAVRVAGAVAINA